MEKEQWTEKEKEISKAWWNYWNYINKPLRDEIQQWWFKHLDKALSEERERVGLRAVTLFTKAIGDTELPEDVWKKIASVNSALLPNYTNTK